MSEAAARIVLGVLASYFAAGAIFAVSFSASGVTRLDPAARGASRGFRLAILPGAALFWPLLLRRWLRGDSTPPRERNAHRRAAR